MEGLFVFERSKKRSTVEYHEEIIDGKKVIFYRDLSQNALESTDYLGKVESGKYTIGSYQEKKARFGMIVLESNLDKSAEEIYKLYKRRWNIETFYDYYKNRLDVNTLHLNDYYKTQGAIVYYACHIIGIFFVHKDFKRKEYKRITTDHIIKCTILKITSKQKYEMECREYQSEIFKDIRNIWIRSVERGSLFITLNNFDNSSYT